MDEGERGGKRRGKREEGRVGEGKGKRRGGRAPHKNLCPPLPPPTLAPWSRHCIRLLQQRLKNYVDYRGNCGRSCRFWIGIKTFNHLF